MKTVRERSLAADGVTMTWTSTQTCPIAKDPDVLREVERLTGPDAMILEMFGSNPKAGRSTG